MKLLNVYTRENCGACIEAKLFLDNLQIPYKEINVDYDQNGLAFLQQNNDKYLPQFYVNGQKMMHGGWNIVRTMRKHEIMQRIE